MSSDIDEPSLKEKLLLEEKFKLENEFGLQRAKFMDIFKQKEDELFASHKKLEMSEKQIEDLKSVIAIAAMNREDDLASLERKFQDEIATLKLIMKESIAQAYQNSAEKFETERNDWLKNSEQMEKELYDLRSKINNEKENSLISLAKTIQRKVRKDDPDDLETSMKKAQEGAEMMKSVVEPLEKEVGILNQLLKEKNEQLMELKTKDISPTSSPPHNEDKVKELNDNLKTEKSSRTDLELYVGVLNIQKNVFQMDNDRLRNELRKTFSKLNTDKERWLEVKNSWIEISNQLSSQPFDNHLIEKFKSLLNPIFRDFDAVSTTQICSEEVLAEEDCSNINNTIHENEESLDNLIPPCVDSLPTSSSTPQPINSFPILLTGEQENHLKEFNPEIKNIDVLSEDTRHLLSSISSDYKKRRIIIESDLKTLQNELLAKSNCTRCRELEDRQKESEHRWQMELATCQRMLAGERKATARLDIYTAELEANIRTLTQLNEEQLSSVCNKLTECYRFIQSVKEYFDRGRNELFEHLKCMACDREDIQKELRRLQQENDSLIGKHSKKAQELQEEIINLPNKLEDMQLLLLRFREDLISSKTAEEHNSEVLRSEIAFLKSHLSAEQQERNILEENLTQEVSALQSQLDNRKSLEEEVSNLTSMCRDYESRLDEMKSGHIELTNQTRALKMQLDLCREDKVKIEKILNEQRIKITTLQSELDNSEEVQRDFVKLSQSLQIQLEKIRSAESEVRWQHDEDVFECPSCKIPLSNKLKVHCRHCGRIFCSDCLSHSVRSGPSMRPSKVCVVCHTILVKDAVPFFSTEIPE